MKAKPHPPLNKAVSSRVWLNPSSHGGSAHISWSVSLPKFFLSRKGRGQRKIKALIEAPEISFHLADCSRKISLEFAEYDGMSRKSIEKKADLLLQQVLAFRNAVRSAYSKMDELKEEHPNAKCS